MGIDRTGIKCGKEGDREMMMKYRPARIVSPGQIIKDELDERGWTQKDLAEIMGRPYQAINEIVRSTKQITPQTARELAQAFGTSPEFWLNLEMKYQLHKSPKEEKEQKIARKSWLYSFLPVKDLIKRNWINGSNNISELEKQICDFLDINSVDQLPTLSVNFRQSIARSPEEAPAVAWVKRVEQLIVGQEVNEYDQSKIDDIIQGMKTLMNDAGRVAEVPGLLNEYGIYFIIVPHLPKTYLDGASFELNGHPIIAMTLRYDRIDSFWFTLLHELAHIALGHEGHLDYFDSGNEDVFEQEANKLASEWLIDQVALEEFINISLPHVSKDEVIAFSKRQNIHPGIVLGQLHKRGIVPYKNMRSFLEKVSLYLMEWIDNSVC